MYARSKKCVGVDPLCIPAYPSMLNPFLGLPPGSLHTPSKPLYVKLSPFLAASPPKPSLFSPPSTPLPKPPSVSQRLLSAQPPAGELARGISCCIWQKRMRRNGCCLGVWRVFSLGPPLKCLCTHSCPTNGSNRSFPEESIQMSSGVSINFKTWVFF